MRQMMSLDYTLLRAPVPTLGRLMAFVDGENLVCRFQAMKEAGRIPHDDVLHIPDVVAWRPRTIQAGLTIVLRTTYYTCTTGGDAGVGAVEEALGKATFNQYSPPGGMIGPQPPNNVRPCVFRKMKNRREKGVDIRMTVDILTHIHQNNLDVVYLVPGDGDYMPVVDEAVRCGKQVYVAALSSGLSAGLVNRADQFVSLDDVFFKS